MIWPALDLLERVRLERERSVQLRDRATRARGLSMHFRDTCDQCGERVGSERSARHLTGRWGHVYCILGHNF